MKEYRRPFMIVEQFTPNEFVAGCVAGNAPRLSGLYCVDSNRNGYFNSGEDRNTGPNYLGSPHTDMVLAGHFEIIEQGRYEENGALGYMYVGQGSFDYDTNLHPEGSSYYDYSGSNFVPLLYAKIKIHYQHYDHEAKIFFADDGSGIISTAS